MPVSNPIISEYYYIQYQYSDYYYFHFLLYIFVTF